MKTVKYNIFHLKNNQTNMAVGTMNIQHMSKVACNVVSRYIFNNGSFKGLKLKYT